MNKGVGVVTDIMGKPKTFCFVNQESWVGVETEYPDGLMKSWRKMKRWRKTRRVTWSRVTGLWLRTRETGRLRKIGLPRRRKLMLWRFSVFEELIEIVFSLSTVVYRQSSSSRNWNTKCHSSHYDSTIFNSSTSSNTKFHHRYHRYSSSFSWKFINTVTTHVEKWISVIPDRDETNGPQVPSDEIYGNSSNVPGTGGFSESPSQLIFTVLEVRCSSLNLSSSKLEHVQWPHHPTSSCWRHTCRPPDYTVSQVDLRDYHNISAGSVDRDYTNTILFDTLGVP